MTRRIALFACALLVGCSDFSGGVARPLLVRGSIASSSRSAFTVKTATGVITVSYGPQTAFMGADRGSPADIVPGSFVGIANVPGAGDSRALEVTVLDETMRGVGEGDTPWDAPAHGGSRMTVGTVAQPHTMHAATKTITVNYTHGSREIAVTPGTPVIRVSRGGAQLLARGASVFVSAQKDLNDVTARYLVVGKKGTVVPL